MVVVVAVAPPTSSPPTTTCIHLFRLKPPWKGFEKCCGLLSCPSAATLFRFVCAVCVCVSLSVWLGYFEGYFHGRVQ